ncbi:MAG: E3 binding domain-containing protein, partial [Verrucomicrobiota bacterium]|nr:E3 binding domain-containing protein [Verrucomicrobiota bacterium]
MSVEVKIPAVGESISSGIVSVWHKKSGDFVNAGDALFTLETDKVSTEISAETAGVLETLVPEGQEVKIGEVVATIDDSKKPTDAAPADKKKEKAEAPSPQSSPSGRGGAEAPTKEKTPDGETLSPAVRRIVDEEHLDPAKISGTGLG